MQLLQQKAQGAEAAALNAETVASAAMSAAESAVREEMEAAAVAKSTATALNNVLGELRALGVSFETTDKLERSLEAKGVSKVQMSAAIGRPRRPIDTSRLEGHHKYTCFRPAYRKLMKGNDCARKEPICACSV